MTFPIPGGAYGHPWPSLNSGMHLHSFATRLTRTHLAIAFGLLGMANSLWGQTPIVDNVTGSVSLSIPIWNIQDRDLQFPLTLNHTANGVRVIDGSGWVGQNWSLSVEAGVYRTVRGLPDDFVGTGTDTRKGWLYGDMADRIKNFTIATDNDTTTCADELANWNALNGFGYNEDTEPDVFHVNAFGLSFQFFFDENNEIQLLPYNDVLVDTLKDIQTNQIKGFSVVSEDGIKYIFAASESVTERAANVNAEEYYFKRKAEYARKTITYNTAWKLSKIISPLYGEVSFMYRDITLDDPQKTPYLRAVDKNKSAVMAPLSVVGHANVIQFLNTYKKKILQSVSTSQSEIDFHTSARIDDTKDEKLDLIKIYEKRLSPRKLIKQISFTFDQIYSYAPHPDYVWDVIITDLRLFLASVTESTPTQTMPSYAFQYYGVENGRTVLPSGLARSRQDLWGYFADSPVMGSIKKITTPLGGYSMFFYEPHEFVDVSSTSVKHGGGLRIRKMITAGNVPGQPDQVQQFSYNYLNGETSGKLLFSPGTNFNTVLLNQLGNMTNVQYRAIQNLIDNGTMTGPVSKYFSIHSNTDLASADLINGSNVAYERVTVSQAGSGRQIYEFDLPAVYGQASANAGEWEAARAVLARPSTGVSNCFERGNIRTGINVFPYPANPSFNYARGLLKKVTDLDEAGNITQEKVFEYQRLYKETTTKKLYGLALEELPTYYHDGTNYHYNKMFLFSKYAIHTGVKTVMKAEMVWQYNVPSTSDKTSFTTKYFFESINHRKLTKVTSLNSDGSENITTFAYAKDFPVDAPADVATAGLAALLAQKRNPVIETISSIKNGSQLKYLKGMLSIFKDITGKALPYQALSFQFPDGVSTFNMSKVVHSGSQSTFQFDEINYRLLSTNRAFDTKGNVTESIGLDKQVNSVISGHDASVPVLIAKNATLDEMGFSDFENSYPVDFVKWPSASYAAGRTGKNSLSLPGGSGYTLSRSIINDRSSQYIFSAWIKGASNGTLTISIKNGASDLVQPTTMMYTGSDDWKYYQAVINVPPSAVNFSVQVYASNAILFDEVLFYPYSANVVSYSYDLPFGKATETNNNGITTFYTYDSWGRILLVRDQDQNIVKKHDYQIRP